MVPTVIFPPSLLDELFERIRLKFPRDVIFMGALLFGLFVLAVYLDQPFQVFANLDFLRAVLTAPLVIIYILGCYHFVQYFSVRAGTALQTLLDMDAPSLNQLLKTMALPRWQELVGIGIGILIACLLAPPWRVFSPFSWLLAYQWLAQTIMMGMFGAIIPSSLALSRTMNHLQTHPMRINLLDMTPLEALGAYGLCPALAIMGGVTLALFVSPLRFVLNPFSILIVVTLLLVGVLAFFWSMSDTHRVMVDAKQNELRRVRQQLTDTLTELDTRGTATVQRESPEKMNAIPVWLAYEERLQKVPEWPVNADMIRNLFVSVLFPGAAYLVRFIFSGEF